MTNSQELNGYNTNPFLADSDGDGLYDGWNDKNKNGKWDFGEVYGEIGDPQNNNAGGIKLILSSYGEINSYDIPDPNYKDIYIEIDTMQGGGDLTHYWNYASQAFVMTPFLSHGIKLHIFSVDTIFHDDCLNGDDREQDLIYQSYFLDYMGVNSPKYHTFRYCIMAHNVFSDGETRGGFASYDVITIGDAGLRINQIFGLTTYHRAVASVFMHELGHTLSLTSGSNTKAKGYFVGVDKFYSGTYVSCMNYYYSNLPFFLVDYSNGILSEPDDHNDWGTLDFSYAWR